MKRSEKLLCKAMNAVGKAPLMSRLLGMPARGIRSGPGDYVAWEYDNAESAGPPDAHTFRGKSILDLGCGYGGKSVYYALKGAAEVFAIDIDAEKLNAGREFAERKGLGNIRFLPVDAARMPFASGSFDMITARDCFEHFDDPEGVLGECHRVLKQGGTIYVSFPPFASPWGAHLFDQIGIPWAQHLFSEETLLEVWKESFRRSMKQGTLFGSRRIAELLGAQRIADLYHLNRMSIARFEELVAGQRFTMRDYRLRTPGNLLAFLTGYSVLREYLVTTVSVTLEK